MTVLPDENSLAYSMAGIRRTNPFDRRRSFASRLMQSGADASPVQHPLQGAARLAQALVGGYLSNRADEDEREATKAYESKLALAMAEPDPQKRIAMLGEVDQGLGARLSGQMAIEQAKLGQQQQGLQTAADKFGGSFTPSSGGAPPSAPQQAGYQGTLGTFESSNNPAAVNPQSGAAGQFQFMPGTWAEVRKNNPDLNLPNHPTQAPPQLQAAAEERFRAQNAKGLQAAGVAVNPATLYLAHRAGVQGATTILNAPPDAPLSTVVPPEWIAQNPDMRTTVGNFLQMAQHRFGGNSGNVQQAGVPPQIAQGSADASGNPMPPPGMPPAPAPGSVSGPTMVAPTIPDVPRPQPSQQQLAQYQQRLASGEFGSDPREAPSRARAALDAELDRDWAVQRDRAKMQFGQETTLYNEQRKLDNEKNNPKFTEDANKAHAYALRLSRALPALEQMGSDGYPGRIDRAVTNLPVLGNTLAGPRGERFDQLSRDIINAILRRESGAVISEEEFNNARKQYIPQPGDAPETVQLKLDNIRTQLKAFADTSNRTPDTYSLTGQRGATNRSEAIPTPATAAPTPGAVEGGYRFKGGNPADQRNWERVQ